MKFRGLVRRFDRLGRIVIPKEYRRELSMEDECEVEMFLTEDGVYIKKKEKVLSTNE